MKTSAEVLKPQQQQPTIFRTPQELVHIKHGISLLQYKYWVMLLRAYRDEYESNGNLSLGEDFVYMSRTNVENALGYQPKSKEIENDLEKIRVEPIVFNVLEKDGSPGKSGTGFITQWFVSSARIGVKFPKDIRLAVENLDSSKAIFHMLNWQVFNSFSGKYEAIIYKLCKDYIGVGKTPYMSIEKYREYMGIKPSEYSQFKQLNVWAISGPTKRVNESEISDILIEVGFKRLARKIVGLEFFVKAKRQSVFDFGDDPAFAAAKVHIPKLTQEKYLKDRSPQEVSDAITRANQYGDEQDKAGKDVNWGGLYRTAIESGWGKEYREKLDRDAQSKIATDTAQKKKTDKQKTERKNELEDEFRSLKTSTTIKSLTVEERTQFAEIYLSEKSGAAPAFDKSKGKFADKVDDLKFTVWLRSQFNVNAIDPDEFNDWLKTRR